MPDAMPETTSEHSPDPTAGQPSADDTIVDIDGTELHTHDEVTVLREGGFPGKVVQLHPFQVSALVLAPGGFVSVEMDGIGPCDVLLREPTYPLGTRYVDEMDVADPDRYRPERFPVLGQVTRAPAGNTVIRLGYTLKGQPRAWERTMHLVLTPAERNQLINDLTDQRDGRDIGRATAWWRAQQRETTA